MTTKSKPAAVRDLFGDIPVSLAEVRAWLVAVPRIDPDGPRAVEYVRTWHVVEKIQAAKLAGTFEADTQEKGPDESGPFRLRRAFSVCA